MEYVHFSPVINNELSMYLFATLWRAPVFYLRLFELILAVGSLGCWSQWVWSIHLQVLSFGPFARELTCHSGTWAHCWTFYALDGKYCDVMTCSTERGDGIICLACRRGACRSGHRGHAMSHCWTIVVGGILKTSSMTSRNATSTTSQSLDDLELLWSAGTHLRCCCT